MSSRKNSSKFLWESCHAEGGRSTNTSRRQRIPYGSVAMTLSRLEYHSPPVLKPFLVLGGLFPLLQTGFSPLANLLLRHPERSEGSGGRSAPTQILRFAQD